MKIIPQGTNKRITYKMKSPVESDNHQLQYKVKHHRDSKE